MTPLRFGRAPYQVLLATDIAGSTATAVALGDREWREVLDAHDEVMRTHIAAYEGTVIWTTGDGFLASFNLPLQAVRCGATALLDVRRLRLQIRAGLAGGRCHVKDGVAEGEPVEAATRAMNTAPADRLLVNGSLIEALEGRLPAGSLRPYAQTEDLFYVDPEAVLQPTASARPVPLGPTGRTRGRARRGTGPPDL